jgi:hypothetical protein
MKTSEQILDFIQKKTPCVIRQTDETGEDLWAVEVDGDFWLNAFETLLQATEYCEANDLPYEIQT